MMTRACDNIAFNDLVPYIVATDPSASISTDIMHTMSTGMLVEVDFRMPGVISEGMLFSSTGISLNYLEITTKSGIYYVGRVQMTSADAKQLQVLPNCKYVAALWKQDDLVHFQKDNIVIVPGDTYVRDDFSLAVFNNGSTIPAFNGRIYEVRTYADWTRKELTHRLVPREDNGESGLFDNICNKYYPSDGKCQIGYERGGKY